MKVGILGPFPPYRGGIATFDYHLWRHLARRSEAVAFNYRHLYPAAIFPGRSQLDESGQPFRVAAEAAFDPFRPWRWLADWRRLASHRLDALVISWWTPLFAPSMTAFLSRWRRRAGIPVAFVCHNVRPHESFPLAVRLQREVFAQGDVFAAHWQGDADQLSGWFPDRTVLKLYHPLYEEFPPPPDFDRRSARRRLGLPPEGLRILLFFGLVRPYKGLDTLLQGLVQLLQGGGSYHLVVAGEFYQNKERFEPLLGELQARGHLTLHDRFIPNDQVADYFTAADAVVLPYRHASQSGVAPLAYAFGRGAVASRVGGLEESVQAGVSGILVAPSDPAALADGIGDFMAHQEAIEKQVPQFARRFGWDSYLDALLAALGELPRKGTR